VLYFHVKPVEPEGFIKPTRGWDPVKQVVKDPWALGYDIYAPSDGFLDALTSKKIPLGFSAAFTLGYGGFLWDRSGMGAKGIARFAGAIEPTYRGEWQAVLYNSTGQTFRWSRGDRIIQVIFLRPEFTDEVLVVDKLEGLDRGGGFGSTGA
jgi:deoxyuridine 5'-triphosphate nucleotidohydrolase